jgi:hypothetical protein
MEPFTLALSLAQFAPSVMRFFGAGQASTEVAQKVANIATTVTGASNPEDALAKLQADSKLAQEFNLAVLARDKELELAYLADVQSARARDIELAKAGRRNVRADVMVLIDALGLVACLVVLALYRKDMSGEVATLISTIASIFGLCLRDAHQFEFGSSRGSREKDAVIGQFTTGQPGTK